jgi:hypothetical protein
MLVAVALFSGSCGGGASTKQASGGLAGEVIRRAIAAKGGWERWQRLRDISYISTLAVFDPAREILSERTGWFRAPLHKGALARMDSIGLNSAVQFGIDAGDTWVLRDGALVEDPSQLSISRFELVSSLFWLSLPFSLLEMPVELSDLGEIPNVNGRTWHRVKAVFESPNPGVPGTWFVLYFDTATWRLDRVHARLRAPFLRHELWVVEWKDYGEHDGLWIERERRFYPADEAGEIVGPLVARQLIEHVRVDAGENDRLFRRPQASRRAPAAQEAESPPPPLPPPHPAHIRRDGVAARS